MTSTTTYSATNTDLEVLLVHPDQVVPWSGNPRKHFDQAKLQELADSIATHGLQQPPVVRPIPAGDPLLATLAGPGEFFYLIMGERRWRATQLAGLDAMPVRVRRDVDEHAALELALLENLQRVDLDPIEEAEGYRQLNRVIGLKQADIAAAVNRSQPAIANAMRLLDLPEEVQERIRTGELSVSHGVALCRFKDFPAILEYVSGKIASDNLTAKQVEQYDLGSWTLQNKGLVRPLNNWDTTFAYKAFGCETCPFGAFREIGARPLCLRPEHYDEFQRRGAEQKAVAARETLARQGQDAGEVPTYETLRQSGTHVIQLYWDVQRNTLPPGCGDDCACRAQALDEKRNLVPICTDPERYRGLEKQERERKHQVKQERHDAQLAATAAMIDSESFLMPKSVLILLVGKVVQATEKPRLAETIKRLGFKALDAKGFAKDQHEGRLKIYRSLDRLNHRQLMQFGAELLLRDDLAMEMQGYPHGGELAAWFLKQATGAEVAE